MLVPNQTVKIKLTKFTKDYYEDKGYKVSSDDEIITVRVEDLPKSSKIIAKFQCDDCGKIFEKQYASHFDQLTKKPKPDYCKQCLINRNKEKYLQTNEIIRVRGNDIRKVVYEVIAKEKQGYECLFPIQRRTVPKTDGKGFTYFYFTKMKLVDSKKLFASGI